MKIQIWKFSYYCRFVAFCAMVGGFVLVAYTPAIAGEEGEVGLDRAVSVTLSGDFRGAAFYSETNSDSDFTTRLRLMLRVNINETIVIAGRLNGTQFYNHEGTEDNDFLVDRLFVAWQDIGSTSFGFTGGRLATLGAGIPSHIRLGRDRSPVELSSYIDLVLDGVILDYNRQDALPGKISFYYARQFDEGYEGRDNGGALDDTDIYGLQWRLRPSEDNVLSLQAFMFAGLRNIPADVTISNPFEFIAWQGDNNLFDPNDPSKDLLLSRVDLGDIYQISGGFVDQVGGLNYFISLGWSQTDPEGYDEFGTGLLSSWWVEPQREEGYAAYVGVRYDFIHPGLQIGAEYNWGSKYWLSFRQRQSDFGTSKLTTRGRVAELYTIWNVPTAAVPGLTAINCRLGYQYYDYKYTGSGFWLGEPVNIDDILNDPLAVHAYSPVDTEYKVYAELDVYF